MQKKTCYPQIRVWPPSQSDLLNCYTKLVPRRGRARLTCSKSPGSTARLIVAQVLPAVRSRMYVHTRTQRQQYSKRRRSSWSNETNQSYVRKRIRYTEREVEWFAAKVSDTFPACKKRAYTSFRFCFHTVKTIVWREYEVKISLRNPMETRSIFLTGNRTIPRTWTYLNGALKVPYVSTPYYRRIKLCCIDDQFEF